MTSYAETWYKVKLIDLYDSPEPDWTKVPPDKLVAVRMSYIAKMANAAPVVYLWGPQIPFFESLPYYRVLRVLGDDE